MFAMSSSSSEAVCGHPSFCYSFSHLDVTALTKPDICHGLLSFFFFLFKPLEIVCDPQKSKSQFAVWWPASFTPTWRGKVCLHDFHCPFCVCLYKFTHTLTHVCLLCWLKLIEKALNRGMLSQADPSLPPCSNKGTEHVASSIMECPL